MIVDQRRRSSRSGLTSRHRRRRATMEVMGSQRFRAVIAAGLDTRSSRCRSTQMKRGC